MSSSNTVKSASKPSASTPFVFSPTTRAGVSVIIRTASQSGQTCLYMFRTSRSAVATLPANALRSSSFATPSSMKTSYPFFSEPMMVCPSVCPAPRMASVTSTVLDGPFAVYTCLSIESGR